MVDVWRKMKYWFLTLRHFPIYMQEMKILDLDNLLICRLKMNNLTKFSLYACNIESDTYGRLNWGTFLGHKTIIVSLYALKQTLIFFLCHEYVLQVGHPRSARGFPFWFFSIRLFWTTKMAHPLLKPNTTFLPSNEHISKYKLQIFEIIFLNFTLKWAFLLLKTK